MKKELEQIFKLKTIRILVEVPVFSNVKDSSRIREEKELIKLINKYTPENRLVLDLGSGTSYYSGGNTIGIDLDKEMLDKAKDNLEDRILADYNFCPFRDGVFDAVVMCHSLEHTNRPDKPLLNANRVLKKGGMIGVSVPNGLSFFSIFELLVRGKVRYVGIEWWDHLTIFTPKILRLLFDYCGFRPIEESGDIVYFPLIGRLKLFEIGFWLAKYLSKFCNVYILIGKKITDKSF